MEEEELRITSTSPVWITRQFLKLLAQKDRCRWCRRSEDSQWQTERLEGEVAA